MIDDTTMDPIVEGEEVTPAPMGDETAEDAAPEEEAAPAEETDEEAAA